MTYEQSIEYIHSRPRLKFTGQRKGFEMLLKKLGNPQDKLEIVHVSGTNGKGSCAKMLSNILVESGYKTGLNTSPFIVDFRERIVIDEKYISKDKLVRVLEQIKIHQEQIKHEYGYDITEFEIVTAMAFLYFYQENCDIVIMETGLGGKDDCTNIIKKPVLTCIMNISYDHTQILGETLSQIAYHKAGIIKESVAVVCYPKIEKSAMDVIVKVAKQKNSKIIVAEATNIKVKLKEKFKYNLQYKDYNIIQSLPGQYQGYNTATVIEAAEKLSEVGYSNISKNNIINGIEKTVLPARIEVISHNPLIIIDGAHNLDGVNALHTVLTENKVNNITAIWASLSDKSPQKIIEKMSDKISNLYIASISDKRAVETNKLLEMASKYVNHCEIAEDIEAVVESLIKQKRSFIVFGSLYLASDVRNIILKRWTSNHKTT